MQAMTLGTIPIVTDTVGTSVYVADDQDGIVLRGVRDAIWHTDPNTGILMDRYVRTPDLDHLLVSQLTNRIFALLDAPDAYQRIQIRAIASARQQFSGHAFSSHFWGAVSDLHQHHKQTSPISNPLPRKIARSLVDCELQGDDWPRVFESVTQPMRRIYTGQNTVWELGGAFVHVQGNPKVDLHDWSVLAQYFSPGAPLTTFANTLQELGGKYLSFSGERGNDTNRKIVEFISRVLMPYPALHGYASSWLKMLRRYRRYLAFRLGKSTTGPDVELVLHGVSGYNVIRYFHKYYAVLQSEGAFSPEKLKAGGYSSCLSGNSIDNVLRKMEASAPQFNQATPNNDESVKPVLVLEGYHGFNIIRLADEYHAILQREGAFEHAKLLSKKYSRSFSGRSLAEIQSAIVASIDH